MEFWSFVTSVLGVGLFLCVGLITVIAYFIFLCVALGSRCAMIPNRFISYHKDKALPPRK